MAASRGSTRARAPEPGKWYRMPVARPNIVSGVWPSYSNNTGSRASSPRGVPLAEGRCLPLPQHVIALFFLDRRTWASADTSHFEEDRSRRQRKPGDKAPLPARSEQPRGRGCGPETEAIETREQFPKAEPAGRSAATREQAPWAVLNMEEVGDAPHRQHAEHKPIPRAPRIATHTIVQSGRIPETESDRIKIVPRSTAVDDCPIIGIQSNHVAAGWQGGRGDAPGSEYMGCR